MRLCSYAATCEHTCVCCVAFLGSLPTFPSTSCVQHVYVRCVRACFVGALHDPWWDSQPRARVQTANAFLSFHNRARARTNSQVNHDPVKGPPQVLSGRAAPGGFMKVLAGSQGIKAGEQVFIVYGGGKIGSPRFLQDYGFLDTRGARTLDAEFAANNLSKADLVSLDETSLEEDRALLRSNEAASSGGSGGVEAMSPCAALAVGLRINLKEARAPSSRGT
mmetsp:Transcript_37751/g.64306  ORF Transcript_37751/g.64306 Transcript_37751/m.64306 type:complete len:221 (-) Transcript_37751:39-701(-)